MVWKSGKAERQRSRAASGVALAARRFTPSACSCYSSVDGLVSTRSPLVLLLPSALTTSLGSAESLRSGRCRSGTHSRDMTLACLRLRSPQENLTLASSGTAMWYHPVVSPLLVRDALCFSYSSEHSFDPAIAWTAAKMKSADSDSEGVGAPRESPRWAELVPRPDGCEGGDLLLCDAPTEVVELAGLQNCTAIAPQQRCLP